MDRQTTDTIRRLCDKRELRERAKLLFHSIKATTGPGSGFELAQRVIAVPAIAALLASEQLGYSDINEKIAQSASCLNPKEFKNALATIRTALAAAEREKKSYKITYEGLVKARKHLNGEFMVACMKDVEDALTISSDLQGHLRPPNDIVTVTVYCWTGKILLPRRSFDEVINRHGIDEDDYQDIVEVLDNNCQTVAHEIAQKAQALRGSKGRKASQLEVVHPSPNKGSPKKTSIRRTDSLQSLSPFKTPTHKRKVAFSQAEGSETTADTEDSPSKRQRRLKPVPDVEPFRRALRGESSATSLLSTPTSSRVTLDALQDTMDVGEEAQGVTTEEELEDMGQLPPPSDVSESDGESDIPDAEMSDGSTSSLAHPAVEPMTPRRSQRQAKPRFPSQVMTTPSTNGTPRKNVSSKSRYISDEEMEETARRRQRPVFLEHRQWIQRDPKVEREEKLRAQWVRESVEKRGSHPFEKLRAAIATN